MKDIIKILFVLLSFCTFTAKGQNEYFPPNLCHSDSYNQFIVDWYSKHLSAMNEPSLWEISKKYQIEVYRFLWLRTFHSPVSIRLEIETNQKAILIIKETDGQGGYEAGKLIRNDTVNINKHELKIFYSFIDSLDYWNLPVNPEIEFEGEDGAQWIIEGIKNNNYHLVDMWTPRENTYKRFGMYLIKLSMLKPKEIY